jgi:predicted transcriptional regulator
MSRIDLLLSIIENPTRRRILQELVREPHYPLQLSRELGLSQQAVIKHLKVLEEHDLVHCYLEESDLGGPRRKIYVPTMKFTIIVDIGPGYFNTELVDAEGQPETNHEEDLQRLRIEDVGAEVRRLRETISRANIELENLQERRKDLVEMKERALSEAQRLVEDNIDDYQLRRVIFEYIYRPDMPLREMARQLALRDEVVIETVREIVGEEES